MERRRLTREDAIAELYKRARTMPGSNFTLSLRQFDRWLAGELDGLPRPSACRVVEAEFGQPIEQLLAFDDEAPTDPASPRAAVVGDVRGLVSGAAVDASKFALWADSASIGEGTVDSLRLRLAHLAHEYVHAPLVPIFGELVALRDDSFQLIRDKRDPQRLRKLYFLAGAACAMLGYASGDLGHPQPAMLQNQTALVCAEKADSPALTAWILGNCAMTSDWFGNPHDGVRYAARARDHADNSRVPGTILPRLASIEARALARLRRAGEARAALAVAERQRDRVQGRDGEESDELDEIGGIMTFNPAKQHFYGGATYLGIGDPIAAERSALAAIEAYADGPASKRSYGDEALAWIDVATARARVPGTDLDGVADALRPVVSLPSELRLAALIEPLKELRAAVATSRTRRCRRAEEISGSVDDFAATCSETSTGITA